MSTFDNENTRHDAIEADLINRLRAASPRLGRGQSSHIDRAESADTIDDLLFPPAPARPATGHVANAPRHAADEPPHMLVTVARIILIEVGIFALLGAGALYLRWLGVW